MTNIITSGFLYHSAYTGYTSSTQWLYRQTGTSDTSGEADRPRERWRKRERKLIVAAKSCKREERAIEAEHGLRQVSPPECSLTHLDQQTALSRKKVHLKLFICLFIYLFLANVQWEEVVITQKEIASLGPNVCF